MKELDDLIYQRLRDFRIPAAVLDTIMASDRMKGILLDSWHQLRNEGFNEDEIAESVAKTIWEDLELDKVLKSNNK